MRGGGDGVPNDIRRVRSLILSFHVIVFTWYPTSFSSRRGGRIKFIARNVSVRSRRRRSKPCCLLSNSSEYTPGSNILRDGIFFFFFFWKFNPILVKFELLERWKFHIRSDRTFYAIFPFFWKFNPILVEIRAKSSSFSSNYSNVERCEGMGEVLVPRVGEEFLFSFFLSKMAATKRRWSDKRSDYLSRGSPSREIRRIPRAPSIYSKGYPPVSVVIRPQIGLRVFHRPREQRFSRWNTRRAGPR